MSFRGQGQKCIYQSKSLVNINFVSKYEENPFKSKEVITNFNNF